LEIELTHALQYSNAVEAGHGDIEYDYIDRELTKRF
jgi:hypothetical protein